MKKQDCPHIGEMKITTAEKKGCEMCERSDHPRLCTSCGRVFCCESENAHDKTHFEETGHPIIKPNHATYDFIWCYACNDYLE